MTDIAPNQTIDFLFSQPVDPSSVTSAAFSLRTASGQAPNGQLLVNGTSVSFIPSLTTSGGVTQFGFVNGETYRLTVAGGAGASQAVRSTSGETLPQAVVCSLTVSRPLVDPNGKPPESTLLAPTATSGVPNNATIVVEFDEFIDISPFQNATTATSPILYRLRNTVGLSGSRQCDPTASAVVLPGVPEAVVNTANQTVQVILKPSIPLPSGVCVEVEVTGRVTDLSGKSAVQATYRFITKESGRTEEEIVEDFANSVKFDPEYSSGTWRNNEAQPGLIGGDGELGEFNVRNGIEIAPNVFEWDTDNMVIPAGQTTTGVPIPVSDGIFRFSRFHLDAGDTMVFTGSNPARFIVRGSVSIEGTIAANAPDTPPFERRFEPLGQPGGPGSVGGGTGGKGGESGDGMGEQPQFDGQNGEDVQLPAGHAYGGPSGRQIGTGGVGSPQFPLDGRWQSITYTGGFNYYSAQIGGGGGGGGGSAPGSAGQAVRTTTCPNPPPGCPELGPGGTGGISIDLLPVPSGLPSTVDHFLVGGSGGGGGGSCVFWSSEPAQPAQTIWWAGAGGAGGGGIVAFRAGGSFTMANGAAIEVRGGNANDNLPTSPPPPPGAPGGGGSGGSCLLQVGGALAMNGTIDAGGGAGGHYDEQTIFVVETMGGDGGPGFVRLESPIGLPPSALGTTIPAATVQNIGQLTDTDLLVGSQSKFYATGQLFPPTYLRYELQIENNGNLEIYTDDMNWLNGNHMGRAVVGTPVRLLLQGGQVDPTSGVVDPSSLGPWREYAGSFGANTSLNNDQATGYRFQLVFDRGVAQNVVVKKLTVYYRT